uniref:non-specific serine/threonine protein kinase n=1 Tax=Caenorhabditis japonica TaxID=281687 RepID=A0A8R1HG24_CAEJA
MVIRGSNGLDYQFLLKGHEDPRQDERVMQLFGLVNTLLANNSETCRRNLAIQRYSIVALSKDSGLIGWVPNCDTLHTLVKEYREKKAKIPLSLEHKTLQKLSMDTEHLTMMQKLQLFEAALSCTQGEDLRKVLWLKSPSSEVWFDRRTNYTRSVACMSMVGYILGLGDRHPSNLMLDRLTGKIVHIDFGDCFEVAMLREKFPEKVPFRLTRMLINAMEITGLDGVYTYTAERVLKVLRTNQESLLAVLEAFVYDPVINWRLVEGMKKDPKATKKDPTRGYANVQPSSSTTDTIMDTIKRKQQNVVRPSNTRKNPVKPLKSTTPPPAAQQTSPQPAPFHSNNVPITDCLSDCPVPPPLGSLGLGPMPSHLYTSPSPNYTNCPAPHIFTVGSPVPLYLEHAKEAITCFVRALMSSPGSRLEDTLRLLQLWFDYGDHESVYFALTDNIFGLPVTTWLEVIPQLMARLDRPQDQRPVQLIVRVLGEIAKHQPQAVIYALTVASKSSDDHRRRNAQAVLDKMMEYHSKLVKEARLVTEELVRCAILWHEQWHDALDEASRVYFHDNNVQAMFDALREMNEVMQKGPPTTMKEHSFTQTYSADLKEAGQYVLAFDKSGNVKDLNQAWDIYCAVFKKLRDQLSTLNSLDLVYVSPNLVSAKDLELAVPGTYDPSAPIVSIASFSSKMNTRPERRPRIALLWSRRLQGCRRNVEQWQRLIMLRGLVLSPQEMHPLRVKFTSMCRKQGKNSMSRAVLRDLLALPADADLLTARAPFEKPLLVLALAKQLYQDEQKDAAIGALEELADHWDKRVNPIPQATGKETIAPATKEPARICAKVLLKLGEWKEAKMKSMQANLDTIRFLSDMPLGHSRRGPRCPKAAGKYCDSSDKSSRSTSHSSSQSRVRFDSSSKHSESDKSSNSRTPISSTANSSTSFLSEEQSVVAPNMSIEHGDRKDSYQLSDKGKLVVITRKAGDLVYMLRCVDGRRVYIEKTKMGASLIITNQKGKIIKALAGQY